MKVNSDTFETMLLLVAVAFLASVGRAMFSEEPRTFWQYLGYSISSGILGLSAGIATLFVANPDPLLLAGIAAMVGALGTETISDLARRYIEKKAG